MSEDEAMSEISEALTPLPEELSSPPPSTQHHLHPNEHDAPPFDEIPSTPVTPDSPSSDRSENEEMISSDEASDYAPARTTAKAKKNKFKGSSEKGKKTAKGGSIKEKATGKGKKKAKKIVDPDEEEEGPKKKVLYCKVAVWKDLPDWEDRTDCPILERLPAEVLDLCFGLRDDLDPRDYVSLAGVNSFFRHYLDDQFFKELYEAKIKDPLPWKYQQKLSSALGSAATTNNDATDVPADPAPPAAKIGLHPFSRDLAVWRVEPADDTSPNGSNSAASVRHYVPRGDRTTWSRAQYEVYKEEQAHYRQTAAAERRANLAAALKEARDARRKQPSFIPVGRCSRYVFAQVRGRLDGQPAVVKDEKGIPLKKRPRREWADGKIRQKKRLFKPTTDVEATNEAIKPTFRQRLAQSLALEAEEKKTARERKRSSKHGTKRKRNGDDTCHDVEVRSPHKKQKSGRGLLNGPSSTNTEPWTVPDTDAEDYDEDKPFGPKKDKDDKWILHDYWRSEWRELVAEKVNEKKINKSEAIKKLKVSEAYLIGLRHFLTTNPMSKKHPQQIFIEAAVEALALRMHGGTAGLQQHRERQEARTAATAARNKQKRIEARKNGTFVEKHRRIYMPPWEYHMHAIMGCDYDDEGFCEECNKEYPGCIYCDIPDHTTLQHLNDTSGSYNCPCGGWCG